MEKSAHQHINDSAVRDFASWLQREFLRRRSKNSHYSLRAFSNYLKYDPATISQLLSGKRRPSPKLATKLFALLDVAPAERTAILSSLKKKPVNEIKEAAREYNYQMIAVDSFRLLSEWHHYAILELTTVSDFKFDFAWIAKRLGVSVIEARQAVDRLLRLELLEQKNGLLVKTNCFVTNYEEGMTNAALKQLQRHVLQKALDAIDEVPADEKDITSMTMAIDITKIPAAKRKIKQFRRELCAFLEDGERTQVFNLGVQLYPISKLSKPRSQK